MKRTYLGLCAIALVLSVVGLVVRTNDVLAQTPPSPNNVNNLRLSPLRTDISIAAGESAAVTVYVQNMSTAAVTYMPISNDFVAKDENGTPALLLDANQFAESRSLKKFMTTPANITVQPKERVAVNVRISVPKDALAGGYFGAIRFAPLDQDGNAQVELTGSAASLILLTVPGDLVEKLTLETFNVRQEGTTKSWFNTPKNLDVLLRFKNEGNVQVTPFGKVLVSKSGKVVYEAEVNNERPAGQTLPESVRRWSIPLDKIGSFGKYTVTASIGYGVNGQTITQERTIWIIPMILIIGVLAGIVLLVFLIVVLPKMLKAYKQKIIRNSRGGRRN